MDFIELRDKIEEATKQAFLEMFEKHKKDEIYAFALYSDEGAMTVCPSTNTIKHLKKQDKDDLLYYKYEPVEWKYEGEGANKLFDEISKFCYDTVESIEKNEETYDEEFEKFSSFLYETCIEVLEKLKSENFFKEIVGEDIFICFAISDYEFNKGEYQEIISRLNNNSYKDEYLEWLETWDWEE